MTLHFDLPYPPSVNHYWRQFRGRMVISKEGRTFRKNVQARAAAWQLIMTGIGYGMIALNLDGSWETSIECTLGVP